MRILSTILKLTVIGISISSFAEENHNSGNQDINNTYLNHQISREFNKMLENSVLHHVSDGKKNPTRNIQNADEVASIKEDKSNFNSGIEEYKIISSNCELNNQNVLALRSFSASDKNYWMYLDKKSDLIKLTSELVNCTPADSQFITENYPDYSKALINYNINQNNIDNRIQANYGFKHFDSSCVKNSSFKEPLVVSIDMCQTDKVYSRDLFERMASYACEKRVIGKIDSNLKNIDWEKKKNKEAIEITVAITGAWLQKHNDYFSEIRKMESSGCLKITWANHSHKHPTKLNIPDKSNFFTQYSTEDFTKDFLNNEKILLNKGLREISVFYRFPGLISNTEHVQAINEAGLIPLAETAWLGKGHKAKSGRIALIHGNGKIKDDIDKAFDQIFPISDEPLYHLVPINEALRCDDSLIDNVEHRKKSGKKVNNDSANLVEEFYNQEGNQ